MKIGIIGFGSWGTAMGILLNELNHDVTIYGRNAEYVEKVKKIRISSKYLPGFNLDNSIELTSDYSEAVSGKDIILLAVSSQNARSVMKDLYGKIEKNQIFVNLSKGIEIESLKTVSQIVAEYFPENRFAALSGPSHAEEVANKLPTTLVSASNDPETAKLVQEAFSSRFLRIYTSKDLIGVELGGSLKNIFALAAGVSDGLGFGDNTKAALMTRGLNEMMRLGIKMGAEESTFMGLAGVGDLIVTCTSMHSRNRRCGMLIGEGVPPEKAVEKIGMVVEGFYTVNSAYELMKKHEVEMPILRSLYDVLFSGADVRKSVTELMLRDYKDEWS